MRSFSRITYSNLADERLRRRKISRNDVELAINHGEGFEDEDGNLVLELSLDNDRILRVIVRETDDHVHVVTAMRLGKTP